MKKERQAFVPNEPNGHVEYLVGTANELMEGRHADHPPGPVHYHRLVDTGDTIMGRNINLFLEDSASACVGVNFVEWLLLPIFVAVELFVVSLIRLFSPHPHTLYYRNISPHCKRVRCIESVSSECCLESWLALI